MSEVLDPLLLQRLVDGALPSAERAALLKAVEQRPELWREVALAFVEEQIWQSEIRLLGNQQESCSQEHAARKNAPGNWKRRVVQMMTVAAALLAMLAVGFRLGQWRQQSRLADVKATEGFGGKMEDRSQSPGDVNAQRSVDAVAGNEASTDAGAMVQLQLVTDDSGEGRMVQVPVFLETEVPDGAWQPAVAESVQSLNRDLRRRGYQLNYRTQYVSGALDEQRQLVVPIRTVALQYQGQ